MHFFRAAAQRDAGKPGGRTRRRPNKKSPLDEAQGNEAAAQEDATQQRAA